MLIKLKIIVASRTIEKCKNLKKLIKKKYNTDIFIEQLDADITKDIVKLLEKYMPKEL